jgi:hypothetical protein
MNEEDGKDGIREAGVRDHQAWNGRKTGMGEQDGRERDSRSCWIRNARIRRQKGQLSITNKKQT